MTGLSLDVGGVLLEVAEPVSRTYRRFTGSARSEAEVARAFQRAWGNNPHRMVGDARPFWRHLVTASTGVSDPAAFEALYAFYATAEAWSVLPGAQAWLADPPCPVVICSNWDTRLPATLGAVGLPRLPTVCSGELGVEKPHPRMYRAAADALGLRIDGLLHVDDQLENVEGARRLGAAGVVWGLEVHSLTGLDAILAR